MNLEFCCPICSAKSYSEFKIQYITNVNMNDHAYLRYYVCDGCSVMFYDPVMFSKKVKLKKEKVEDVEQNKPEVSNEYVQNAIKTEILTIYTDGSFRGATKQSGWGFIVYDSKNVEIYSESGNDIYEGGEAHWNIGAECTAAIKALEWVEKNKVKEITLCHDYEGVAKWITGAWKANKTFTQWYTNRFKELSYNISVSFKWVKGHAKDTNNNAVDKIAGKASR